MAYKLSEIGEERYKKLEIYVQKISPLRNEKGFWKCCGKYSNSWITGTISEEVRMLSHLFRMIVFQGDKTHMDKVIEIFGLEDGIFVLQLFLNKCINGQIILKDYIKLLENKK